MLSKLDDGSRITNRSRRPDRARSAAARFCSTVMALVEHVEHPARRWIRGPCRRGRGRPPSSAISSGSTASARTSSRSRVPADRPCGARRWRFQARRCAWRRWARELSTSCTGTICPGTAIWKMNCRADVVEPELLRRRCAMPASTSSTWGSSPAASQGLEALHKQMTVEQNLARGRHTQGARSDVGIRVHDARPVEHVPRASADNLAFLRRDRRRRLGCGGRSAACFPTTARRSRTSSSATGRMRGDVCNPDYDFLDPRLDGFHRELTR